MGCNIRLGLGRFTRRGTWPVTVPVNSDDHTFTFLPPGDFVDNQIVYLEDVDLRRSKICWGAAVAAAILSLVLGVRWYDSPGWETRGLVMLITSALSVVVIISSRIILSKPERRPHLLVRKDGIRVRQSYYKQPRELSWDKIASVDIEPNLVVIHRSEAGEESIRINLLTFEMNKQMQKVLSPYVAAQTDQNREAEPQGA